jgi:uncharacterized protein (TIGR02246 family)
MVRALLLLAFLPRAAADTSAPGPDCAAGSPPVEQARAVATGIIEADNRSDLERVIAYYADDAVLLPPNEPPARGREAIRPRYAALFAAFAPAIESRIEEVCVSGPLAFVRGHNGGRMAARAGGGDRALDDVYLMLLRRGTDGEWRISHLMWHRASPPPAGR